VTRRPVRFARAALAAVGLAACAAPTAHDTPAPRPGGDGGVARPADEPGPRAAAARRPVRELEPALAVQAALAPVEAGPPDALSLELLHPPEDAVVSDAPEAYLAGELDALFGVSGRVDAVLVVDVSASTGRDSGADVDRDRGRLAPPPGAGPGPERRDPDDSILAAEVASARVLLDDVDPRTTRLAIVTFSGLPGEAPAARTEAPLTHDLPVLARTLAAVLARGAAGRTDMAAGLDRAVREVTGAPGAHAAPDPEARKVVVFLTDGTPTLPHESREANERAVLRAADRAAAAGVRVFSFAIGPEALERPVAAVEMARRTGGVFTPVRDPRDLKTAIRAVRHASFESLEIRNLTTGAGPSRIRLGGAGHWEALVPLAPGRNRLWIRVVMDGLEASAERVVHHAPGAPPTFVAPELAARREALRRRQREVDVAAGDEARRVRERWERIRRERDAVRREAERQLKELELRVGP
jgi:hypothetical protein